MYTKLVTGRNKRGELASAYIYVQEENEEKPILIERKILSPYLNSENYQNQKSNHIHFLEGLKQDEKGRFYLLKRLPLLNIEIVWYVESPVEFEICNPLTHLEDGRTTGGFLGGIFLKNKKTGKIVRA